MMHTFRRRAGTRFTSFSFKGRALSFSFCDAARLRSYKIPALLFAFLCAQENVQAQNVGIGTTNPTQKLDVNGNLRVRNLGGATNGRLLTTDSVGNVLAAASLPQATAQAVSGLTPQGSARLDVTISNQLFGQQPADVALNGTTAYVVSQESGGLQVIDCSSPQPVLLSTTPTSAGPVSVATSGTMAYVGTRASNKLELFDCSNPAAPVLRSVTNLAGVAISVNVQGTMAYVFLANKTLQIFDCSNPASPVLQSTTLLSGAGFSSPVGGALTGTRFFALFTDAYHVWDVSDPANPVFSVFDQTPGMAAGIAINGNNLFISTSFGNKIAIYDLAQSVSPMMLSEISTGVSSSRCDLAVSGGRLFLSDFTNNKLHVIDVSNPSAPALSDFRSTGTGPSAVAAGGNQAYVVNHTAPVLQAFSFNALNLLTQGLDGVLITIPSNFLSDNLGNHTATRNLDLATYRLVGNGGTTGLAIASDGTVNTAAGLHVMGNAGIGNNDPQFPLDVSGRMRIRSGGTNTTTAGLWLNNNVNTATRSFIGMYDDDNLGIFLNTSRGWGLLQNINTGAVAINGAPETDAILRVHGTAKVNALVEVSDARYKQNIQPIASPLTTLLQLKGKSYEWNRSAFPNQGFDSTAQMGFIAQEVEKVLPQLVTTDSKGYKAINYTQVIPLLTEAIREQQTKIEQLEQQVQEIKKLLQQR